MSAVEEYRGLTDEDFVFASVQNDEGDWIHQPFMQKALADAAIAELEAENAALLNKVLRMGNVAVEMERAAVLEGEKRIAKLEAERNAAIDHMTEVGVEACRERDARIAELEANDVARTQWTYDFVGGMARSAGMLIQWRCEQAAAENRTLTRSRDEAEEFRLKGLERIAELEARLNTMSESYLETLQRAVEAEAESEEWSSQVSQYAEWNTRLKAELAALKGRRCETCKLWDQDRVGLDYGTCGLGLADDCGSGTTCRDFGCINWAERGA